MTASDMVLLSHIKDLEVGVGKIGSTIYLKPCDFSPQNLNWQKNVNTVVHHIFVND